MSHNQSLPLLLKYRTANVLSKLRFPNIMHPWLVFSPLVSLNLKKQQ